MGRVLALTPACLLGSLAVACGDDPDHGDDGPRTAAPACEAVAIGGDPRALFDHAVVDPDAVRSALPLGDMFPGALEALSFELGFALEGVNVPVIAPADLSLRTIEATRFLTGERVGETDYGMAFSVCSDGAGTPVVEGWFAHVTGLAPELAARLDGDGVDCARGENPRETSETCTVRLPETGPGRLVVPAGAQLGSAGGTGRTEYRPGLDFNLLDTRHPNRFVNPDRIGADEGLGRGFRFGVCAYAYFVEPFRSAYLSRVGLGDERRRSRDAPCGTLSFGRAGTAAGVWVLQEAAHLDVREDAAALFAHLVVLGPSPITPDEHQVISAEPAELSAFDGQSFLLRHAVRDEGDVDRAFEDMTPGTVHCVRSEAVGATARGASFLLALSPDGETLTMERVPGDCAEVPAAERRFGPEALTLVR